MFYTYRYIFQKCLELVHIIYLINRIMQVLFLFGSIFALNAHNTYLILLNSIYKILNKNSKYVYSNSDHLRMFILSYNINEYLVTFMHALYCVYLFIYTIELPEQQIDIIHKFNVNKTFKQRINNIRFIQFSTKRTNTVTVVLCAIRQQIVSISLSE